MQSVLYASRKLKVNYYPLCNIFLLLYRKLTVVVNICKLEEKSIFIGLDRIYYEVTHYMSFVKLLTMTKVMKQYKHISTEIIKITKYCVSTARWLTCLPAK